MAQLGQLSPSPSLLAPPPDLSPTVLRRAARAFDGAATPPAPHSAPPMDGHGNNYRARLHACSAMQRAGAGKGGNRIALNRGFVVFGQLCLMLINPF